MQVLREVCDKVLKDHSVSEAVLVNRAKVCTLDSIPSLDGMTYMKTGRPC